MQKLKKIFLLIALIAIVSVSVQGASAATLGWHKVWYDLNGNGVLEDIEIEAAAYADL